MDTRELAIGQDGEPVTRPPHSTEAGSVQFVGTATVLIRFAGFTILTDPNFLHRGDHVHLGFGLTSERLTDPAFEIDELPPVDFVLLSHYHEDHFDRVVQRRLARAMPIVTTPGAARTLAAAGFEAIRALPTWKSTRFVKDGAQVRATAMPARHGPAMLAGVMPQTMGSLLDFSTPGGGRFRLYVSGDTLVYRDIEAIPRRFPGIDLALLHLGGTRVLGILVTMDAAQGVEATRLIDADVTIPIHYNDYTVFRSPLEDIMQAVDQAGLGERVRYLRPGQTHDFTARR